jgi:hypothetical protein
MAEILQDNEIQAYQRIRSDLSGLTLTEAYHALGAAKDFIGTLLDNIEDADAFIIN